MLQDQQTTLQAQHSHSLLMVRACGMKVLNQLPVCASPPPSHLLSLTEHGPTYRLPLARGEPLPTYCFPAGCLFSFAPLSHLPLTPSPFTHRALTPNVFHLPSDITPASLQIVCP